ncbi:exported hypothetical protein [Nitrospina gracilis 3/211]|uniref:Uncharacterized protein n=2 Tax=Nitrospinaceae TaxID=407032 RepID=M1Z2A7_NITG3|nr:exported hypothetical protein [Nitrospina gracilis 3/211]
MFDNVRNRRPVQTVSRLLGLFLMSSLFFANVGLAEKSACEEAAKQLRGNLQTTQAQGGVWGYMEKATSLRGESMIGFQVDSKLARLVTHWDTLCGKNNPPSQETFNIIASNLDLARQIVNKTPGRTPPQELMKMIQALNQSLDKAYGQLGL